MITVWDRDVPAPVAVLMLVTFVLGVSLVFTLIDMAGVCSVEVAVVYVVDVVPMRQSHMPAALAVSMRVVGMCDMCTRSHFRPPVDTWVFSPLLPLYAQVWVVPVLDRFEERGGRWPG